jgi:hypothetical protein
MGIFLLITLPTIRDRRSLAQFLKISKKSFLLNQNEYGARIIVTRRILVEKKKL